jgi:methionyl-tRNA synthetase
MDTKWKRLSGSLKNNYGISQADMYQMYAYQKKYEAKGNDVNGVTLLYPMSPEKIDEITIDDFAKVSLKVGQIIKSEKHPNAEKLLVSQIKIGNETRQIVSGIAKFYDPNNLIGKKVIVVTNLKPVKIRGVESFGMVLCASNGDDLELIEIKELKDGSIVR